MLRELQTFQAVVRHGSFASAASKIGLTQSAVSAQIHRLEEELGFDLFDRTGRTAILNAAGYEALEVADEIMAAYARLGRNSSSSGAGLIRIGAISSAQLSFMPTALAAFRVDFPDCRVRLVPGVSLNLLGQVDAGEIDIAVIVKPRFALPSDLQWRPLLAEPFFLLVQKQYESMGWREVLETNPLIRYDRTSFDGRLVDQFLRRHRVSVRDAVELDELQGMVHLVSLGVGVAILPTTEALSVPLDLVRLPLGTEAPTREIGLVERPSSARQATAASLATLIVESVAA